MAFIALALTLNGCEEAPAEPVVPDAPRALPTVKSLEWTVPPTWNIDRTAKTGIYRARYHVPPSGNAREKGELLIMKVKGPKLDELLARFEGPNVKNAKRDKRTIGAFAVEILEVDGTYKYPVGPAIGPKHKQPASMLKENWRTIAASVDTKDRGVWYFELIGHTDTVAAARSAFIDMLSGLH